MTPSGSVLWHAVILLKGAVVPRRLMVVLSKDAVVPHHLAVVPLLGRGSTVTSGRALLLARK